MTGTLLPAWGLNLAATAVAALILFLAAGLGARLLALLDPPGLHPLERRALSLALGLGTIPLLVLALGWTGNLRPLPVILLLAGVGLVAFSRCRRPICGYFPGLPSAANRPVALLVAGAALVIWLLALSPTIFYDALVYHLALPNLFLLRGVAEPISSVVYSHFPLGTELLSVPGMVLLGGRFEAAMLVNAAGVLLAAAGAAALARHLAGAAAGWTAAALFLVTPMPLLLARLGTAEPLRAAFVVLGILALLRSLEEDGLHWTAIGGLLGGMAYGTKYLGGLEGILLPALLLAGRRHLGAPAVGPGTGSRLAVFLGAAALPALPWMVRTLAATGNPVYPALHGLLGGAGWGAEQARLFAEDAKAVQTMAGSWRQGVTLPIDLLLLRRDFGAAAPVTWLGPLAIGAAIVLGRGRDWRGRLTALALAGLLAIWVGTFWMARFLLPALAVGAAAAGAAAIGAGRLLSPRRWAALLLLLAATNAAVLLADAPTRRALLPALGIAGRESFLEANLRAHPVVRPANDTLPPGARLLAVGETRVAYLRRDHLHGSVLDRPPLAALAGDPPSAGLLAGNLAAAGITHILVNLPEWKKNEAGYPAGAVSPAAREAFFALLQTDGRLLARENGVYLYELRPGSGEGIPAGNAGK